MLKTFERFSQDHTTRLMNIVGVLNDSQSFWMGEIRFYSWETTGFKPDNEETERERR